MGRTDIFKRITPPDKEQWVGYAFVKKILKKLSVREPSFCHSQKNCDNRVNINAEYRDWIRLNEPRHSDLRMLEKELTNFQFHPKISIIIPVSETNERLLRLTIESVLKQVYPDWELYLVDCDSEKCHVKTIIKEFVKKDLRIKALFLPENKNVPDMSNEALETVTGEYVGFLRPEDLLSPVALFGTVQVLNKNRDLNLIYSDEDSIDIQDNRKDPVFKPDWSPDLFLACNYLGHFIVVRTVLFKKIGGFQRAFEGVEDYDLILRITEQVDPSTIAHIPQILYHSRITEKSAHEPFPAKSVIAAGKRAVGEALRRRHEQAVIEDGLFPGSYRVRYEISGNPEVTIIIPTKDKAELVRKCVNSIITKTKYQNYRILLVENQSSEQETFTLYDCLLQNPNINLIRYDRPFNFSAMNNYAVSQVRSPYILFLNNDIEVISGEWLSSMIEHIQRVGVGAVGAKLMYPDNTVQHAGVIIGICGIAGHSHRYFPAGNHGYLGRADIVQDVSAVTAACMIMKKEFFVELKGFDEDLIVAYNDVDLCLRIRQSGRLIIYTPYARLYHHESVSRGNDRMPEKVQRAQREFAFMRTRWGSVIDRGDPYYNPNLTRDREDFSRK